MDINTVLGTGLILTEKLILENNMLSSCGLYNSLNGFGFTCLSTCHHVPSDFPDLQNCCKCTLSGVSRTSLKQESTK